MNKAGRPKTALEKKRAPGISIRLTPEETRLIKEAVTRYGIRSKSEFARKCLLYIVKNDIRIT